MYAFLFSLLDEIADNTLAIGMTADLPTFYQIFFMLVFEARVVFLVCMGRNRLKISEAVLVSRFSIQFIIIIIFTEKPQVEFLSELFYDINIFANSNGKT